MDIREHNRLAWDKQVQDGSPWTTPVTFELVDAARKGRWEIFLTPTKPVPSEWLPNIQGRRILCLAGAGGQQGPILAAAGATVTVLDNSRKQLEQDQLVAKREGLLVTTIQGDMANLEMFSSQSFDVIVHPVSNCFVPDVRPVWREAFRVLCRHGVLISGFNNPVVYLFDQGITGRDGSLEVKHVLPYADVDSLTDEARRRYQIEEIPFEFSHTLESQIAGQITAGFVLTGFYEDHDREDQLNLLNKYTSTYIATRAMKP